jgi:hypothetical protein
MAAATIRTPATAGNSHMGSSEVIGELVVVEETGRSRRSLAQQSLHAALASAPTTRNYPMS